MTGFGIIKQQAGHWIDIFHQDFGQGCNFITHVDRDQVPASGIGPFPIAIALTPLLSERQIMRDRACIN
jgi:hypothetical protein